MRFFFILFAIEVLIVRNNCFISLSRIKRTSKKDNEDVNKNDTFSNVTEKHISDFTNPQTGENPYVDIIEAETIDNIRNFDMLDAFQVDDEFTQITEDDGREEVNGRSNIINIMEENLSQRDGILMNDYSLGIEEREERNSSWVKENITEFTKLYRYKDVTDSLSTADVDVFTPTSFIYVNVTSTLVNSLSSTSIETYLIAATSVIFLMAAVIIVFGVWKWRWLGRQQRINNDKRTVAQNHV